MANESAIHSGGKISDSQLGRASSGGPVIRDHAWRSFFMTYVPLTTITVILILLLSWPATAQNEAEGAVQKLAEATATAELVQRVCFLKTREARIDELTAKANVTKKDMEPDGRYGAIVAAAREQVHTGLARTLKRVGRKDFCEYAWHAYGAYGERIVRRPR